MIDIRDLRWPTEDVRGRFFIVPEAQAAIPHFLPYIPNRRGIIQAGGNVGVYPILLAQHFKEVRTVEPDATNYACLEDNLLDCDDQTWGRVIPMRAALSDVSGKQLRLNVTEPDNCGAHQFMPPIGDEPTVTTRTIDDLTSREPVDCIWLDIEGAELPALRGAMQTIAKHSPVIILEEKGHGKLFGWSLDELHAFLAGLGYAERATYANDRLYTR